MFIPMIYSVMNAFKPLEEFFYFPPHFFPRRLTLENFTYLFQLMSSSWVPFSRYIFNTVFITVAGVLGNLIISSLCAYALSKIPFPGHKFFFQLIQKSLMFSATVAGIINFISWPSRLGRFLSCDHRSRMGDYNGTLPHEAVHGLKRLRRRARKRTSRRIERV